MKKIKMLLFAMFISLVLVGCGSKVAEPDYTEKEAEIALNNGENLEGKTVQVKVATFVPDGALGYTIQAGKHLNYISSDNPNVKEGDEIVVKIKKVENVLGSFVMSYEKQ
ncbi:hypothetical protein [Enterococcus sp. AZ192]|uniref:hypothetical protein n=1 Tax=unclassified Enterococcus TaxID=2608891 RepID=UPI003D27BF5C